MLSTFLTTLPPVVHIISTELEIPLTAVTVQSGASGSPIVRFPSVPFSIVSLSKIVICTRGIGTVKVYHLHLLNEQMQCSYKHYGRISHNYTYVLTVCTYSTAQIQIDAHKLLSDS